MNATERFRHAVESAYAAFADVPGPTPRDAARYEERPEILPALTAFPLRQLPEEIIGLYAGWAITTAGNEHDFMHFLPRIIEVAADERGYVGLEPQVVASRLIMAGWTGWDVEKREAVKRCFRAAFVLRLERADRSLGP
jgi:hypothetical protein